MNLFLIHLTNDLKNNQSLLQVHLYCLRYAGQLKIAVYIHKVCLGVRDMELPTFSLFV